MKKGSFFALLPCLLFASGCSDVEYINYSVVYYASEGGKIMETGMDIQTVFRGEDAVEVEAVPNDGYVFVIWSDGLETATRQDKHIHENLFITAYFAKEAK